MPAAAGGKTILLGDDYHHDVSILEIVEIKKLKGGVKMPAVGGGKTMLLGDDYYHNVSLLEIGEREKIKPIALNPYVNSICNLNCRHCCVGWMEKDENNLEISEWKNILSQAIKMGISYFCISGREPLMAWKEKTFPILRFLKDKEKNIAMSTNGVLLDGNILNELKKIQIDVLEISLDGTKEIHEKIRGKNTFEKTLGAIQATQKRGITTLTSFTLMKENVDNFFPFLQFAKKEKIQNVISSLYFPPIFHQKPFDPLYLDLERYLFVIKKAIDSKMSIPVTFVIYYELFEMLGAEKIIKTLEIDEYFKANKEVTGVIRKQIGNVGIIVETLPTGLYNVRISADGYRSDCIDMSNPDFRKEENNLRRHSLREILGIV